MLKLVNKVADRLVSLAVPAASAHAAAFTLIFCYCYGNKTYYKWKTCDMFGCRYGKCGQVIVSGCAV